MHVVIAMDMRLSPGSCLFICSWWSGYRKEFPKGGKRHLNKYIFPKIVIYIGSVVSVQETQGSFKSQNLRKGNSPVTCGFGVIMMYPYGFINCNKLPCSGEGGSANGESYICVGAKCIWVFLLFSF